MVRNRRLD